MENKVYSQREFAKLVGLSLATVNTMVKAGALATDKGKILESEVKRLQQDKLKSYSKLGTLVISFDSDLAYIEAWKNEFMKIWQSSTGKQPRYFTNVDALFDSLKGDSYTSLGDAQLLSIQLQYNTKILSQFISRYNNAVESFMCSMLRSDTNNIATKIPAKLLYEYIKFGEFISVDEFDQSDIDSFDEIIKGVELSINDSMCKACDRIVSDLCLYTSNTTNPLITREQLTPEFFCKEGNLYNKFFTAGENNKSPISFAQNKQIYESVLNSYNVKHSKSNMDTNLSDGYFTIYPVIVSDVVKCDEDAMNIYNMLARGLFSNVFIIARKQDYLDNVPKNIQSYLSLATIANPFSIRFAY